MPLFLLPGMAGFTQVKIGTKTPVIVASKKTMPLVDNSEQYKLAGIKLQIKCTNMSWNANAEYNLYITTKRGGTAVGGEKKITIASQEKQFYNNNQDPAHKIKIYIYTPTSAIADLKINGSQTFSLKDFETGDPKDFSKPGNARKNDFDLNVFGYVPSSNSNEQHWTASFCVQFKFVNGGNTIYKYYKMPLREYTLGVSMVSLDFSLADMTGGNANFPADAAVPAPVIK